MEKSSPDPGVRLSNVDGFLSYLPDVYREKQNCDIMLSCNSCPNHSVLAHQVVLASASQHLRDLLEPIYKSDPNATPNLIFTETSKWEISQFLNFIYGKVPVIKDEDFYSNSLFRFFQPNGEEIKKQNKVEVEVNSVVLEMMVPGMPMEIWDDLDQGDPVINQPLLDESKSENLDDPVIRNKNKDETESLEKESSMDFSSKKAVDSSDVNIETFLVSQNFKKSKEKVAKNGTKKNNLINEQHFVINNQIDIQEKCMAHLAPDKQLVCCKKLFGHLDEFRGHQRKCHKFPPLHCPYKDKGCQQRGFILKQNVIIHAFLCSFGPNRTLDLDQNRCPICTVISSSKQTLKSHMLTHVSQKERHAIDTTAVLVLCPFCGKNFKQHYLPYHIREVHQKTESSRYHCKECNRLFVRKEKYEGHLSMFHGAPKRYMCNVCGKQFSMDSDLCKHRAQVHTLKAELPCGTCGKKFITGERLRRHELTHSGVKPWTCQVCSKSYPRKDKLNAHIKKKHPDADLNTIPSVQVYKDMKIKSSSPNKLPGFSDGLVNH